jgi:hypothetical protein
MRISCPFTCRVRLSSFIRISTCAAIAFVRLFFDVARIRSISATNAALSRCPIGYACRVIRLATLADTDRSRVGCGEGPLAEDDRTYNLWCYAQKAHRKGALPADLNWGVLYERRYAFEWLDGVEDWDEVTCDA